MKILINNNYYINKLLNYIYKQIIGLETNEKLTGVCDNNFIV